MERLSDGRVADLIYTQSQVVDFVDRQLVDGISEELFNLHQLRITKEMVSVLCELQECRTRIAAMEAELAAVKSERDALDVEYRYDFIPMLSDEQKTVAVYVVISVIAVIVVFFMYFTYPPN